MIKLKKHCIPCPETTPGEEIANLGRERSLRDGGECTPTLWEDGCITLPFKI